MEIPAPLLDAVLRHCRDTYREEACGILAGPRNGAGPTRLYRLVNVAEHPCYRYAFDVEEQLAIWQEVDTAGGRVFAIYHSHTVDSDRAEPSPEDLRHALDPEILHLIVHGAEARLWKVVDGCGIEQPYTVRAEWREWC